MYIIAKLYTAYQAVIYSQMFARLITDQAQLRTDRRAPISFIVSHYVR